MRLILLLALLTTGCATVPERSTERIVKVCAYNTISALMLSGRGFLSLAGICEENQYTNGVEL